MSAQAAHRPTNEYIRRPPQAESVAIRPTPYLFDLHPGRDSTDAWALVDLVRRGSGEGCDLRLMVNDAQPWLEALAEVADILRCDVYVSPAGTALATDQGDVVAVDPATNTPTDWLILRPVDVPVDCPTWFDRQHGRIAPREGLVALPFSGGLAFATRRSFHDLAAICADPTHSQPDDVTTVAFATRSGQFEIGWYHGPEGLLSGADFARLITASVDDLQANVRLVMDWPEDPEERSAAEESLRELAKALPRTVWVRSDQAPAAGGPGAHGVGWVRVQAEASPPTPDWPVEHQRTLRHVNETFRALRFDHPDEAAALQQASALWSTYVPAFEHWLKHGPPERVESEELIELRRQLMALPASEPPPVSERPPATAEDGRTLGSGTVTAVATPPPLAPRASIGSPKRRAHGIDWLPPRPWTNTSPIDQFVWSSFAPVQLAGDGLPTSDLFLLASSDVARICSGHRSGHVLRLVVPPGRAVELAPYAGKVPARLQHRVRESWATHLIPLVWLSDVTVREVCYLDGRDELGGRRPWPGGSLPVRFVGAAHGVPNLPHEVVRWPARRQHARAHMTLPYDPSIIAARLRAYPGWLPLYHDTPHVPTGHYLLDIDIEHRAAIDLPATLATLAGIPVAAASLWGFNGVELVLPTRDFARTSVVKVHGTRARAAHPQAGQHARHTLADILPQAIVEPAAWASVGFG